MSEERDLSPLPPSPRTERGENLSGGVNPSGSPDFSIGELEGRSPSKLIGSPPSPVRGRGGQGGEVRSRKRRGSGLPLPLLLAWRYARGGRRDAYVRFLSNLATGGVALGVGALVLVLSGLAGLQGFLREDVLARTPHLEIELPPGAENAPDLLAKIEALPGAVEARPLLRGRGWLLIGKGAVAVDVVGYDGDLPGFFPQSAEQRSASAGAGVYVGDGLSVRYDLEAGRLIEIVSPRPTLSPLGPQPRIHSARIAGTFTTGHTESGDNRVALPLPLAEKLFGSRQRRIEVRAESLERALELQAELPPLLPAGSKVFSWRDLNRGLFFALKLERIVMFLAVFLIVPVAATALVTVLALIVSSKRGEIGMLQAMGGGRQMLERAFLALGAGLAGIGLFAGLAFGIGGALLLDHFELLRPPGDVYYLDHIPFRIRAEDLLLIVAGTLLLTLGATRASARRASSLEPLEALRLP
jgi:lipoprotein-releasing system permease protein